MRRYTLRGRPWLGIVRTTLRNPSLVVVVMWDLMVSLFASGSLLMISARVSSSPDSNTSRISAWVMHVFLSVMIYSIVAKTTCMTTSTRVPIASDLHKRLKKEAIDRDMTLQSLVTEILSAHFDKTTSATVPQKPKGQRRCLTGASDHD